MEIRAIENPVTLKIDYKDQILLKITIPIKFDRQRFFKHTVIFGGFSSQQEYVLSRKYYSYLNQGDLIQIFGDYSRINWKQKQNRQTQTFLQMYSSRNSSEKLNKKNQQQSDSQNEKSSESYQRLKKSIQKTFKLENNEQNQQVNILTILLNFSSSNIIMKKVIQLLLQQKKNPFFGGIFVKDPITSNNGTFQTQFDKWSEFYVLSEFQSELKQYFYNISKLSVRKIHINLKCLDGQLTQSKKALNSKWTLNQQSQMQIDINYPKCNRIYIYAISIRNLGMKLSYKFELQMNIKNIQGQVMQSLKQFQIFPPKQYFQKHDDHIYNSTTLETLAKINKNDQSLSCDQTTLIDKITKMRILCERTFIEIRNNILLSNNQSQADSENSILI